ncbi:MAG: hypothetical protein QXF59_05170 [Candidatus Bathyarchaeia archaeon]
MRGRKAGSSPPTSALTPSIIKKADIAPRKTERVGDLAANMIVHIWVLSPSSDRRIRKRDAISGVKSKPI